MPEAEGVSWFRALDACGADEGEWGMEIPAFVDAPLDGLMVRPVGRSASVGIMLTDEGWCSRVNIPRLLDIFTEHILSHLRSTTST
jgi:hypothetical protein